MADEPEHNPEKNEMNPCNGCSKCCEYIAMEIDEPEDRKDFQQIRWFLAHKDVWIFLDHDDSWNIQFNTDCEKLEDHEVVQGEEAKVGIQRWCGIYDGRPDICIDHSSENCDKWGQGESFTKIWRTMEEFDEWLKVEHPEFL